MSKSCKRSGQHPDVVLLKKYFQQVSTQFCFESYLWLDILSNVITLWVFTQPTAFLSDWILAMLQTIPCQATLLRCSYKKIGTLPLLIRIKTGRILATIQYIHDFSIMHMYNYIYWPLLPLLINLNWLWPTQAKLYVWNINIIKDKNDLVVPNFVSRFYFLLGCCSVVLYRHWCSYERVYSSKHSPI